MAVTKRDSDKIEGVAILAVLEGGDAVIMGVFASEKLARAECDTASEHMRLRPQREKFKDYREYSDAMVEWFRTSPTYFEGGAVKYHLTPCPMELHVPEKKRGK